MFKAYFRLASREVIHQKGIAMSLVLSTPNALCCLCAQFSPMDLVAGYNKTNTSPILKLFLSRIDDLIARM
jgi:hypothetical protein